MGPGWGSYVNDAPYEGGRRFGDVLGEQVRFRMVRSGATSIVDVRPDSAAAERLWEQPSTRTLVQGVLDLANDVSGSAATPLRGFTFSTSEAGYVANRAVHHFRDPTSPSKTAYEAGIEAARRHTTDTAAVRKGAWLHLDPQRSAGLLHVLEHPDTRIDDMPPALQDSLGRGVKTLLHELNHVGSPRPKEATTLDWLSEGAAETLARWPGRVEHAGKQLGIEVPKNVGAWFDREGKPYQEEVDSVRALLALSGIDPTSRRAFGAAENLLNGTPEHELPAAFAERIARHERPHGAPTKQLIKHVEQAIASDIAPDGSSADPGVVARLASVVNADRLQARREGI